jgi:CRP/FNR family transcriptional regulator, cyclic AMP receptor protein
MNTRRVIGTWRWPPTTLLGGIAAESRQRLLAAGSIHEYPGDHTLMCQGDPTRFVIVLLDGVVKATGVSSSGKESLIGIIVGGDLVGEFAALDNRPRSATVTTCGLVSGCLIRQPDFLAVMDSDRELLRAVHESVVAKARVGTDRRIEFTGFDAPTRFARIIRELALAYGVRAGNRVVIGWPITQNELASLASVAEPTAQKALSQLRKAGVISTGYRKLTVEDLRELDKIAGP